MKTIKAFIKRHPLLTFFALTLAISWGCVLIVLGPGSFPGTPEQLDTLLPLVVLAILAGPSVAGVLTTVVASGRAGFRELGSRLLRWRVGARWYAVALLTVPLTVMATLLALALISPVFLPDIFTASDEASLLLSGIVAGLTGASSRNWAGRASPCRG